MPENELTHKPAADLERAEPRSLLEAVMREVHNPSIDPARLKEFLEIGERLEARQAKQEFSAAMAALQPQLPFIKKNGLIVRPPSERSKHGSKSPFAKWDDIHRACMPLLAEHGFSVSFASELQGGNALRVTMTVKHVGGHSETGSLVLPWLDTGGSKSPGHQAISSFTLAQRHVFIKYFNILTEDQDTDGSTAKTPDLVTEDQARRIEDMCAACEEKEPGMTARFGKWLKAEMHVDGVRELFQGEQLDAVQKMLATKMGRLKIK